jgi:hypothetical protein
VTLSKSLTFSELSSTSEKCEWCKLNTVTFVSSPGVEVVVTW